MADGGASEEAGQAKDWPKPMAGKSPSLRMGQGASKAFPGGKRQAKTGWPQPIASGYEAKREGIGSGKRAKHAIAGRSLGGGIAAWENDRT